MKILKRVASLISIKTSKNRQGTTCPPPSPPRPFSRRAEFERQLIRAPLRHLSLPRHFTSLSLPTLVVVSYRRASTRGVPYLTTDVTQKDTSEMKPLKAISFALGLVPCDFCIHPPVLLFIHLSDVTFWVAFDKWDVEGEKIRFSIKKTQVRQSWHVSKLLVTGVRQSIHPGGEVAVPCSISLSSNVE